ncbi:hypothetical protein [Catellatospora sp. NPDC049609]|uniref:hypothetical protein n=1 Tax=Catellatospora sp. NPDC049609 TaxID=3155505 RepID=UPI003444473D
MARVMVGTTENVADQARLAVLISDYEMAREDERTHIATMAAMIGVAVGLATALVAVVSQACPLVDLPLGEAEPTDCVNVKPLLLAAAPLPTLAALAFMQMIGITATLRSYYMRAIETELQRHAPGRLQELPGIPPASYIGIMSDLVSLRRGRLGYRLLSLLLYICVVLVYGGLALYVALLVPWPYRVGMIFFYGLFAVLFSVEVFATTVAGKSMFLKMVEKYADHPDRRLIPRQRRESRTGRRLWSYLLVPRPQDWIKWIIVPVVFGLLLAAGVAQPDRPPLLTAVLLWFVLEWLVYPARYQWNDIVGLADDVAHPAAAGRLRLPGRTKQELRRSVAWSWSVLLVRVALAFGLGAWLGQTVAVAWFTAAVFGIALLYEFLRGRPAAARAEVTTPVVVALWVMIGLGYVLRVAVACRLLGFALDDVRVWLVAVPFGAFGIMFVTMTWALEATSFCRPAGPELQYAPLLRQKPHIAALLPYLGRPVAEGRHDAAHATCGVDKMLEDRGRLVTPWNLAAVAALLPAGPLSLLMATGGTALPLTDPRLGWTCLILSAGAAGLLLARRTARRSPVDGATKPAFVPATAWRAVVVAVVAILLAGAMYRFDLRPLFGVVPWLVFAGFYTGFRTQSYRDLQYGLKNAITALGMALAKAGDLLLVVLVGRRTAHLLRDGRPGVDPVVPDGPEAGEPAATGRGTGDEPPERG